MSQSSSGQRVSFRSLRKKFIAGATASVLALGALVGFAGPAVANGELAYTSAAISGENKIVTLTFNKDLKLATGYVGTLKDAVTFAANGTDFVALGASDTAVIAGSTIVVTFDSALTGSTNKIKVTANVLEDLLDGEVLAEVITEAITAIVADTIAPVITDPADANVTTTESATWTAPVPAVTDEEVGLVAIATYSSADDGATVTDLTSARAHLAALVGNKVTVTYNVTDAAGNPAASVTAVFTSVADPAPEPEDTTAPVFVSAATNAEGTKVVLTYDGALSATTAAAGTFVVKIGSTPNVVTAVAVVGSTVELTLTTAVVNGNVVTVGYTDPTAGNDANAIQDAAGNDAVTLVDTTTVTNTVAPVVSSPAPSAGGGGTIVAPPVQAPIAAPVAVPQITRSQAFAANSAKLSKDLRVSIREALASNPNAKSAVCRGFVASATATAADRKLARDRSTAVCNLITKLNPDLDVEVKKVMVASSSKQLRKVRMVLR